MGRTCYPYSGARKLLDDASCGEASLVKGRGGNLPEGKGITSFLYDGDLIHESGPGDSDACLGGADGQILLKLHVVHRLEGSQ